MFCNVAGTLLCSLLGAFVLGSTDLRAAEKQADDPASSDKKNFVIVPIPVVEPTFGNGLVVGGAYFY